MLKTKAAKELLKQWMLEPQDDWDDNNDRFEPALRKLPAKLRTIGLDLAGIARPQAKGYLVDRQDVAVGLYDKLTKADRAKLLRVFFGDFARYVELTWEWMKPGPCAVTEDQLTPFRAGKRSELTLCRRGKWLTEMIELSGFTKSGTLNPEWLAAWVPHIEIGWRRYEQEVGILCAAVIDKGTKKDSAAVFDVLRASLLKEHEIGGMGYHIPEALLGCGNPEGWELIEKTLLAAQRQEGLRQVILKAARAAHPKAFRRLLRLLVENKLVRFSSVVREMDEWFGLAWSAMAGKKVHDTMALVLELLEKPGRRKPALSGSDAATAYLALWATAVDDAASSIPPAKKLLAHEQPEMRFVAAMHLTNIDLPEADACRVQALQDDHLTVAACAMRGVSVSAEFEPSGITPTQASFEALAQLISRIKSTQKLKPLVWPWTERTLQSEEVGHALEEAAGDDKLKLLPYLSNFGSWQRQSIIEDLAGVKKWSKALRTTMLEFVGDRSAEVSAVAVRGLLSHGMKPADAEQIERYLTRTSTGLRNGIVDLLLSLKDRDAISSAERLMDSAKNQRLAGLEILRQLAEADRSREPVMQLVRDWSDGRKLLKGEKAQVEAILDSDGEVLSLENGLGLFDPADRTRPTPPRNLKIKAFTPTVLKILKSLDDLIHKHRKESVTYRLWGRERTELLGEINYGFPPVRRKKTAADLPLAPLWQDWYDNRPASLRDKDGFELIRAAVYLEISDYSIEQLRDFAKTAPGFGSVTKAIVGTGRPPKLRYDAMLDDLLGWLIFLNRPKGQATFVLNVCETLFAMMPKSAHERLSEPGDLDDRDGVHDWRDLRAITGWLDAARLAANELTAREAVRDWTLHLWRDEPVPGAQRIRPSIDKLARAFKSRAATLTDLADHLIGPRRASRWGNTEFESLRRLTARRPDSDVRDLGKNTRVRKLMDRVTGRLLEIEVDRGEGAGVSTEAALSVDSFSGGHTLLRLLKGLGQGGFKKHRGWSTTAAGDKPATLTELVSKTFPDESDTPADFAQAARAAMRAEDFPEERLLQLAFLAPQWTSFVEATIKWPGFAEGIYWYMAHMGHIWEITDSFQDPEDEDFDDEDSDDDDDVVDRPQKLSRFERLIRERTSLTQEERRNGAIDVAWFHRTYQALTPKRFETLAEAARFAATPQAAKKAQFISDVLLGKVKKQDIVSSIRKKHLREQVRLLGLLPLPAGKKRDADILDRYEVLEEYRRYANKLSSMTRPDALRACEIGMWNLAATAGFPDPMRLQWTLEAAGTSDLAAGPVVVRKGDVSLTLKLDDDAAPELTVRRGEKVLKSLPAAVRKDRKFVELRERSRHVKRQASRVRRSLEEAMLRGDGFSGAELMELSGHAILWPQLSRLVLIGEGIMGYAVKRGKGLLGHSGKTEPVKKSEQLRIAHAYDLLKSKAWSRWQHECFANERLQPFKQVFRELYVPTAQEKKDRVFSARYSGQQVNPKQAYALWGRRGWSVDEYEDVFKAFPQENLIVQVTFDRGVTTPLEVEGLTVERVRFRLRDQYKELPITKVPPVVFSEIMRDMDLVVSVAHVGDVDPEASASTVDMRESLLKETCQLLGIKNVKTKAGRALIKGELGDYSVHLGSGVVHRMPGGSVCIVPVHSQHRGRLFLPFADDDPRTAEVVSKTLLLARDNEIDDPIILEQLRSMA